MVTLWLGPPGLEQSRAMGEAHQVGALDGAAGAPSSPCVLPFSSLFNLSSPPPSPKSFTSTCQFIIYLYEQLYK